MGEIPMYTVGRMSKGDAECMYENGQVGCSSIMASLGSDNKYDIKRAKEECNNYIVHYPDVTLKSSGKLINLKPYRCGKNGENYKLWNNTGYDNPDDECYRIKNNVNAFSDFINTATQKLSKPM